MEILEIFNIKWTDENNHEQLLREILDIKRKLTSIVREVSLIEKEKNSLSEEKDFYKYKLEETENMTFDMQEAINKLVEELDNSNEMLMENNFISLATRKELETYKGNMKN